MPPHRLLPSSFNAFVSPFMLLCHTLTPPHFPLMSIQRHFTLLHRSLAIPGDNFAPSCCPWTPPSALPTSLTLPRHTLMPLCRPLTSSNLAPHGHLLIPQHCLWCFLASRLSVNATSPLPISAFQSSFNAFSSPLNASKPPFNAPLTLAPLRRPLSHLHRPLLPFCHPLMPARWP